MTSLLSVGKKIEVLIVCMDDEGRGRGTLEDGGSLFDVAIRGALPGDNVVAIIERIFASRQLLVCRVSEYLEKSAAHVERVCAHKGPCPACPLHGAEQSVALEIKRARIERALLDQGIDLEVEDVLPHPENFGYRQKVKLMVGGEAGAITLGVYIPYSHQLVAADACPYLNHSIRQALVFLIKTLNEQLFTADSSNTPGLRAAILRAGKEGVALILVSRKAFSEGQFWALQKLVDAKIFYSVSERVDIAESNSILGGTTYRRYGPELITPLEGGFPVDPDSFCQTDPMQALHMYELVADYLTEDTTEGWFLDGYAGVGGFSKALLTAGAKQIIAVEQAPSCLASLEQLGVQVYIKPMEEIASILSSISPLSGMVVDPPKKGLMHQAEPLAKLNCPRVVLVSCDPDAMAKDLKTFLHHGYTVDKSLPIDLFGGTPAIETVVFMRRSDAESGQ